MITIFVQNKPLFLTNEINKKVEDYVHRPDTIFIDELSDSTVKTMLLQLEQSHVYAGVFQHENLEKLIEAFKSHLTVITASGGLVYTPDDYLLLIFRKGKWDLPKGKLDEGENLETCALREIKEETGADNLNIIMPLDTSYHTYHENGKHILKESHWFLMTTKNKTPLQPQTEEDIEKCEWVSINNLSDYISNMHSSIKDVVNEGVALLKKNN